MPPSKFASVYPRRVFWSRVFSCRRIKSSQAYHWVFTEEIHAICRQFKGPIDFSGVFADSAADYSGHFMLQDRSMVDQLVDVIFSMQETVARNQTAVPLEAWIRSLDSVVPTLGFLGTWMLRRRRWGFDSACAFASKKCMITPMNVWWGWIVNEHAQWSRKARRFFLQITWRRISLEEEALAECRSADFFWYQAYHRWAAINLQCETAKIENEGGGSVCKVSGGRFLLK